MQKENRHILSVLVENSAGVLSQVSRMFSRKGYNIDSLAVGTTEDPTISRMTILVNEDEEQIEQIGQPAGQVAAGHLSQAALAGELRAAGDDSGEGQGGQP